MIADVSLQAVEDAVNQANRLLGGLTLRPEEVIDLVQRLHRERQFGLARKVLDSYSEDPRVKSSPQYRLVFAQKHFLSTYKDLDLQADAKLERALRMLREADDLHQTANQETLGLAGAIYKCLWELTAQARHLETALTYYLRGFHQGVQSDYGYTAINAAFVLDLLAGLENPEAQLPNMAEGVHSDCLRAGSSRAPSGDGVSGPYAGGRSGDLDNAADGAAQDHPHPGR